MDFNTTAFEIQMPPLRLSALRCELILSFLFPNLPYKTRGNINSAQGKRGNDINSMTDIGGFLGNGGNIAPIATSAFGGNSNGLGGFQIEPNGFQGSSSTVVP